MKILDRYILKSFIVTFATVFVILFLIFVLQTVWLFIGELAGKDLDLSLIFKFLMYKMPSVVPLVLPLSIVLSSIMTFGGFSENYEFAAMKSAGISLRRAMHSLVVFIAVLSLASFFFANNVIPFAEYKFINFRRNIAQVKPAMAIAEGQFNSIGTYNIKVDKKSGKNGNKLSGVTIHKKGSMDFGSNTVVIKSKNGELQSNEASNTLKLVLNDGYYYEDIKPKKYEDRNKMPFAKSSFKKYIINIDLSKLNQGSVDDQQITNTNTMLNIRELNYTIDSLNRNYNNDLKSFSDNIYQRTGISVYKRPIAAAAPVTTANKTPDLLSLVDEKEKVQILKVAAGNVTNTIFTIDGTKYEMDSKQKNINNHWIALYDKFVVAFSCFLMFFIGAPLGAIIRKGGLGLPIVFAVLIFIIFHFVNTFGKKVAQENGITPFLGTWLSTFILGPLAIFLTYRATNDRSVTLSFDWLVVPFQKLFPGKKPQFALAGADDSSTGEDVDWRKLDLLADTALFDIVRNVDGMHYAPAYQSKAKKILISRGHEFDVQPNAVADKKQLTEKQLAAVSTLIPTYNFYAVTALASNIAAILCWIATQKYTSIISIAIVAVATLYFSVYNAAIGLAKIEKTLGRKIGLNLPATLLLAPFYIFIYFYNRLALKKAITT
ncbi:MAG: YjgP/YjgQ family permease [Flavobacterium sp.]|nr:MAG: YjgP/YjgQ family permease [Flavobacterium sp.]